MGMIENLIDAYQRQVSLPWEEMLSEQEKIWFCVYEPPYERRIEARLEEFRIKTLESGHLWRHINIAGAFESWLIENEYHEEYFRVPSDLEYDLLDFIRHLVLLLRKEIEETDANTIVAVTGIGSLYGIVRASAVIDQAVKETPIPGRLVFFFPGDRDARNYRLLKARDGWNYLATPIEAEE
ncbi:hypothetical protein RJ53_02725 [Methanocalculus chunghsingensis]|uniref:DUF1788 domain-containing protein n=2 Tax=Methanocalculus chunghsingensis TaxID=156457 RepID=A0A8J7W544_9EURY|nr:hypothetical protein [Methanocalculus chunghsingensis]